MPESVKISELNSRQAVPTDILPAIDSTFSQTVRVTAGDIAAIGGGPPGDGTVSTVKLANSSVTYPKIQNVVGDRLLGRNSSTTGVVEEVPCTALARSVLSQSTSAAMCAAMGALASTADATFTGPIKFADGTAGAPSITNIGDTNTGMFFPAENTIGFAGDGFERFRISDDGSIYTNYPGTDISEQLRGSYFVRAWLVFNGTVGASWTIANQHTIAQRYYGSWGSMYNDAATKQKIIDIEAANGITASFPETPTFSDKFGRGTFPAYQKGTESRYNYTSPGDDVHRRWNGTAWASVPATSGGWLGTIVYTSTSPTSILGSGNIASISRTSTGVYAIRLSAEMPDANYAVVATAVTSTSHLVCRISSVTTTGFTLTTTTTATSSSSTTPVLTDATLASIVIVR